MSRRRSLPMRVLAALAPPFAALAIVSAPFIAREGAAQGDTDVEAVRFSHAVHRETDDTLACGDCHDASATLGGKPTLKRERCAECHDEIPVVLPRAPKQTLALAVDHRPHAQVACSACHAQSSATGASAAAPASAERVDDEGAPEHVLRVRPSDCLSCHATKENAPREAACVRCHGRDEKRERPATHASAGSTAWRTAHGRSAMVMAPGAEHGQSCVTCHRESSCKSCHRVEQPRDHTAVWAGRTHGMVAAMDRARCQTCHETSSCVGCHRATEPRNHTASWRSTHGLVARSKSDASCATCHRASFCVDCHRGGR